MSSAQEKEGVKAFGRVVDRMTEKLEKLKGKKVPQSEIYFRTAQRNYYRRVHEANVNGKPVFMTGLFMAPEILHAMDIACYPVENHAAQQVVSVPFEESEPL